MKAHFDEATSHILIVDDDTRIRKLLHKFLLENGFRVSAAGDATEAQSKMEIYQFDALVLDVMMPGATGFEFTDRLRQKNNRIPILLLTALGEVDQRIEGLKFGADDYLPKPFAPVELLLRLKNLIRRTEVMPPSPILSESIHFGDFLYIFDRDTLIYNGTPVSLTTREQVILRRLARAHDRAVARAELLDDHHSERAIDVQINRLRSKIERNPHHPLIIQTVRGAGYILRTNAS